MKRLGTLICLAIAFVPGMARGQTFQVVAHRGLLQHAPENTLANFRACLELRLGFEFDVQRTRDGRLVCLHDATVDRTTNGTGKVADLTWKELRRLDAGQWFDARFAGEKVPTIEDVFQLLAEYASHPVLVAVDVKIPDVEQDLVSLAEKYRVLPRLLFIGRPISEPSVRKKLKASGKASVAVLANQAEEFAPAVADSSADWVYVRFIPSREEVALARKAGKRIFIAGASVSGNTPRNWQQAVSAGVDGILTDFPLELRAMTRKGEN